MNSNLNLCFLSDCEEKIKTGITEIVINFILKGILYLFFKIVGLCIVKRLISGIIFSYNLIVFLKKICTLVWLDIDH